MAKIYETKEDFEKDKLKDQAKDMRLEGERQNSFGLALIGLGLGVEGLSKHFKGGKDWLPFATTTAVVLGFIESMRSYLTNNKAHMLELQRERMGPAQVVLPPEMQPPELQHAEEKECGCKHKEHRQAVHPKTLMQQAERPEAQAARE